ncbi:MAG: hypothetical protein MUE55_03260 [Thermoplasmata archaeon]|nr:hypothetical protein [Thermoplasmata archaeon]
MVELEVWGIRFRSYAVLIALTASCAVLFTGVAALNAASPATDITEPSYVSAHTALQLLSISASLSIFGVRWTSGRMTKDLPNLLMGTTFMTVGLFHLFHALSYPGVLEPSRFVSLEISTYFRVIARITIAAAFLGVAFFQFRRKAESSDSAIMAFGSGVYVLLVFSLIMFQTDLLPRFTDGEGGLTGFGRAVEYGAVAVFAMGSLKYWSMGVARREVTHKYTSAALMVAAFGELSFSLHGQAYDATHLAAHGFEFASFLILFLALLRESVAMPFETLKVTRLDQEKDRAALKAKTKEAEEAKLRAQAHLDFLAHDVSNIISPIVTYSEMLLSGENLTAEQRKYAEIILKQSKKGGTFVSSLRRLAAAEAIPPSEFVGTDLVSVVRSMEEVMRSTHPLKAISTTQSIPAEGQAVAPGGEHVENVIYEVLKDLVEDFPDDSMRLFIAIQKVKDKRGRQYWRISIRQKGRQFTAETLAEAKVIYDPRRGLGRGTASTYAFCSSIVSHFGGRLWVENVEDGEEGAGRRVNIELPTADTAMAIFRGDMT